MDSRFDRNIRFFGAEGQARLRNAKATIIGAGGVGSHVLQQLAFLGVGSICVVDAEQLADTNRNRYVTCQFSDPVPGSPKVEIAERLIRGIDPNVRVAKIQDSLVSETAFRAVIESDYVFGCVDSEGARLILTELCDGLRSSVFRHRVRHRSWGAVPIWWPRMHRAKRSFLPRLFGSTGYGRSST